MPAPPQVNPGLSHSPQSRNLPQASPMRPQYCPPGFRQAVTHGPASGGASEHRGPGVPGPSKTPHRRPSAHGGARMQHGWPLRPHRKQRFGAPTVPTFVHPRPSLHAPSVQHLSPKAPQASVTSSTSLVASKAASAAASAGGAPPEPPEPLPRADSSFPQEATSMTIGATRRQVRMFMHRRGRACSASTNAGNSVGRALHTSGRCYFASTNASSASYQTSLSANPG